MEDQNGMSPSQAILDFKQRYFVDTFKGKTKNNPEYQRCYEAFRAARHGRVSMERAKGILQDFAPGKYSFTEKIEAL